jgi:hypothetical protein
VVSLAMFLASGAAAAQAEQRFSQSIEVANIPKDVKFLPVSCRVDFSDVGAVDERTLRLWEIRGSKKKEIPYQFSSLPQPRSKTRQLLPNTPPAVSYASEFSAGTVPNTIKVTGDLAWIIQNPNATHASFELEFAIPTGVQVQVPFQPQNLRTFDEQGRGTPVRWFPNLQIHPQWPADGVIHFNDGRDLITSYHIGPALTNNAPTVRRPFFYPVMGPDNIGLTEFGKPHDPTGSHAHHYSLWITHNSVNGIDFWGQGGGVIAHESLELQEDGPIFARVVQRACWRDKQNDLLRETRTITAYSISNNFRALDIEIALTPAASNAVTFGKTSFGFLAARVAQSMTPFDGSGEIRASTGKINESQVHLTHAEWLDQSGPVAPNLWGGVAILDHPENPRFPTGWHCRNDGWAGAAFNIDARYVLEPGAALTLKYRVILHRHDAIKGEIARRFQEWRSKPRIELGAVRKL